MSTAADGILEQVADAAGLMVKWKDAHGRDHRVAPGTLRIVLESLEVSCATEAQCRDSLRRLNEEVRHPATPPLVIAGVEAPVILRRAGSPHYRLELEDGTSIMGTARDLDGDHVAIPGVRRPGYHSLEMGRVRTRLAVVPQRAPSVAELTGRAYAWVLGAQIYSLRRRRGDAARIRKGAGGQTLLPGWETGGDFSAVGILAREAAEQDAVGVAISPVHAMFTADSSRQSPYAPSSRLFLNAMYADPMSVFEADMVPGLLHHKDLVLSTPSGCMDWPTIHSERLQQLRRLYEAFISAHPERQLQDFNAFREHGGEALASHAIYEALHAHHAPQLGPGHGWRDWPSQFHEPQAVAVQRFAQFHEEDVQFHAFMQWLAARSLAEAQACARDAGMPIGLIADMAVGTDPRGSHAWSRQDQIISGLSVGAPPDIFQPMGQNWGLTAFSPRALQQHGYEGFIETVRAALAHAGGVRVDHILGMARMWLVPSGASASEGVYLRYPRDSLMDLLVLEAWRHQAVAIGENLGTVPADFNEALSRRGILGMSVLWFEQKEGDIPAFRPSHRWPSQSMAMVSTHDLPTLRGWWKGRDLDWRRRLGHYDTEAATEQLTLRTEQKAALWLALQEAGLADQGASMPEEAPTDAIFAFVAGTPSVLLSVAAEDLLGEEEQPNLPAGGSDAGIDPADAHPNWCRVLEPFVDELLGNDEVRRLLQVVRQGRQADRGAPGVEALP